VAKRSHNDNAFTLLELLVVIGVIAILASLMVPALNRAKDKARLTTCLNNLRQINLGMRLYADDHGDVPPGMRNSTNSSWGYWIGYKQLIKNYVAQNGAPSPTDKPFACPADRFYFDFLARTNHPYYTPRCFHDQPVYDYSSYWSNAGAQTTDTNAPGLKGRKLGLVNQPTKTVLVAEMPAYFPYSWHQPRQPVTSELTEPITFNNAKNMVSYVDGHASYIKIYWNSAVFYAKSYSFSINYEPPAGYDYKWTAD